MTPNLKYREVSPEEIWATDGMNRDEAAKSLGLPSRSTLYNREAKYGFRRPMGVRDNRYIEGPCLDCHTAHPVENLTDDHLCTLCENRCPDLEAERAASRKRMQDPERMKRIGKRRPVPQGLTRNSRAAEGGSGEL